MAYLESSFQAFLDNAFPLGKKGFLTREEELLVIERAKAGDKHAESTLLAAHYRMILRAAIRCRRGANGCSIEDLFQEGYKGFVRAIRKFEPERGFRFITYASPWVRQAIQRYAAQNKTVVHIPTHVNEKIGMIRRRAKKKAARDCAELSEKEILKIAKLNRNSDIARALLLVLKGEEVPLKDEVGAVFSENTSALSDDTKRAAHEPRIEPGQIEACADYEMYDAFYRAFSMLSAVEQEILQCRYFEGKKLKEIAMLLVKKKLRKSVVSGERIRVIGKGALAKLRAYIQNMPAFNEFRENGYF